MERSCKQLVHSAFSNGKIVFLNLDKLLWMGLLKVCATTLTWGCSWNFDNHTLRCWRQNSPASSRHSSPSMLSWEASNRAINPSISSWNVCLSLPLLSQNFSNMSVRCSMHNCTCHQLDQMAILICNHFSLLMKYCVCVNFFFIKSSFYVMNLWKINNFWVKYVIISILVIFFVFSRYLNRNFLVSVFGN